MKKRLLLLALTLIMIAGLFMAFTLPAAAADAPSNLRIEPSETNGIPAQIDVFKHEYKVQTGGTTWNPTYTYTYTYELYLPGNAVLSECFLSWDGGATATVDGNTYPSGECPVPEPNTGTETTYTFDDGTSLQVISYQGSSAVPAVFIVIDESEGHNTIAQMDGDEKHEITCTGEVYIVNTENNNTIEHYDLTKMKGRGNVTWSSAKDKKPYNITLAKKINFPGITSEKSKKWTLLAEVLDPSLMRNRAGFHLAKQLGVGQDTNSADVWMNGEYQGCYTVTPKTDSYVTNDGYMIEQDNYLEGIENGGDPQFQLDGMYDASPIWQSGYNRITVKKIGDNLLKNEAGVVDENDANLDAVAKGTIKPWLQEAWDAIRSTGGTNSGTNTLGNKYTYYIDLESFAKMYLMHEYVKSYDVCAGSLLYYRDGNTAAYKLIAGPLWDLDNALGSVYRNNGLGDADNPRNGKADDRRSGYGDFISKISEPIYKTSIYKTLRNCPGFMDEVYRQYNIHYADFQSLEEYVDQMIIDIGDSARMNHIKVTDLGKNGGSQNNHNYDSDTTLNPPNTSNRYMQVYLKTRNSTASLNNWDAYAANLKTFVHTRSLWFADNYVKNDFVDPSTCEHNNDESYYELVETIPATCTATGLKTYVCSLCGDRKTESIALVPHTFNDEGECTVCGVTAIEIPIVCDEHASVTVYATQSFDQVVEVGATSAYPRDKASGQIVGAGSGQIYFIVNPDEGYTADVTAEPKEGNYNKLKNPDETGVENGYNITKITGEFTITVSTAPSTYTVTWMNQDGSQILETDENVPYGTAPDFSLADPARQADEAFSYEFVGWATGAAQESGTLEADLPAVSGDVTYYAAFLPVVRTYTVTWMSQDGSQILETDENVPYGTQPSFDEADPTKASTDEFNYTFTGWFNEPNKENGITENQLNPVAGNVTYYATFSEATRTYTVTWMSQDGSQILETDEDVPYGTAPDYNSAELTKPATSQFYYTFVGWAVSSNQTSGTPEEELTVIGDMTYYAAFGENIQKYTVTWMNQDGSQILETDEDVPYGTAPDYNSAELTKPATSQFYYTFVGWATSPNQTSGMPEGDFTVTGDVTYYAAFSETLRAYPITFVNDDGTVLQSSDVAYGYTPAYTGATPTKAPDEQYTYTFAGWDPEIASVSGPATYTATYSAEEIGHTVSLNNLTNGKAEITVISDGGSYSGAVTFKVNCADACAVRYSINGGETYTRLTPAADGSYTLNIDQDMLIAFNVMGDVNGDGELNNKDVTRLMRYIKYHDVEAVDLALDVNGDGFVNNKDVTRLMRYIKYHDVEIF